MARGMHFLTLLARVLRMRITSRHLYTSLKYSLLVVVLVTHAALRRTVASCTHVTGARDVASTLAPLALMLAILNALRRLKMLASHTMPSHVILWAARLVHLVVVS